MNTRTGSAESSESPTSRWVPWIFVALVIAVGAIAAVWLSARITPLMDTIR